MKKDKIILAIESSCDDTACAILSGRKVLSNVVANQSVHAEFGGVVPELASRAHQAHIVPVVDTAIKKAGIQLSDIDAIAFTSGPGLLGSLLVGTSFAKSLSMSLNVPLLDVHHMRAHVLAHLIEKEGMANPTFPFLCLTVSGGHTQIVKIEAPLHFEILGETIDDAAGEAFDKTAKMLGLPYPGGPEIDRRAKLGNADFLSFSKPKIEGLDFSFSGLKTSILYTLQAELKKNPDFVKEHINDICASVQKAIVEILVSKLKKAVKTSGINRVALAGGVSANSGLRSRLSEVAKEESWELFLPPFEFTTDNAAMIGIVGHYMLEENYNAPLSTSAKARMTL